jgi:hypothetical protein
MGTSIGVKMKEKKMKQEKTLDPVFAILDEWQRMAEEKFREYNTPLNVPSIWRGNSTCLELIGARNKYIRRLCDKGTPPVLCLNIYKYGRHGKPINFVDINLHCENGHNDVSYGDFRRIFIKDKCSFRTSGEGYLPKELKTIYYRLFNILLKKLGINELLPVDENQE